jgi:FkbM family methyltransferase
MLSIFHICRPIFSPILSFLRKMLVTEQSFCRHRGMKIPTPWDYAQFKVERDLHSYLHTTPEHIKSILVVGANVGDEVEDIGRVYSNASFVLFEPSPRYYQEMFRRHEGKSHVRCVPKACGDALGKMPFYELPMHGNGSFLKPSVAWKHFNMQDDDSVTELEIDVTTLDEEVQAGQPIDLLWVDVQGAELHVLKGASATLQNTKAVFLEVALCASPYEHGALLRDLESILEQSGHKLVLLGLDPWNYTGNALWIQNPHKLMLE